MTSDIPERPHQNTQAQISKTPMSKTQAEMYFVSEWKNYYNSFIDCNGDFIPEFVTADQNIMLLPIIYERQGKTKTQNWDKIYGGRGLSTANFEDFICDLKARESRWIAECRKHNRSELIMSFCRDICSGEKTPRQARDERGLHYSRVMKLLCIGLNKWCIANGLGNFQLN